MGSGVDVSEAPFSRNAPVIARLEQGLQMNGSVLELRLIRLGG
jgi:hypothetical protein